MNINLLTLTQYDYTGQEVTFDVKENTKLDFYQYTYEKSNNGVLKYRMELEDRNIF